MTEADKRWSGRRLLVVSPTPTHPQDHGNRKRIFEICRALQGDGASIHFAHYAAEHDWRHARPTGAEQQMRETCDAYDLIAPSRALHAAAIGRDHTIDEWADPSLSGFVAWACRIYNYDAVIVNYTWLSFCLEAVPPGIFKILDTHDAFGKRRAMLGSLGVDREFFHTTPDEEAAGLARADLVWAIKDAERDYFISELGARNCLTVLHAEPETAMWRAPSSQDGFLRAGVFGARNNVNRSNLEQFLAVALPLFNSYLADVMIVIAGGCADDFAGWRHPNVEILGRVEHTGDFYRAVDVVIAPIAASTGLKIKVSEAFAAGAPVLALAHATEGFPTAEPLHLLADFKALAMELVKLAYDREPLAALARASHLVSLAINRQVAAALEQTRLQLVARERGQVCVVAPMAALDPDSVLYDHLFAVLEFIRKSNPVTLYLTGPAVAPKLAIFESFGRDLRVFADPELIRGLAGEAPVSWSPVGLADLFAFHGFERAYLMADCAALLRGRAALARVYVRHDAVLLAGGDADALVDLLRATVPTVILSGDPLPLGRWADRYGVAATAVVPFRQTALEDCFTRAGGASQSALLVIGREDDPLVGAIRHYAAAIAVGCGVLDPDDPATAAALVYRERRMPDPRGMVGGAKLVLDLSSRGALARVLTEAAGRAGVPVITPLRGAAAASGDAPTSLLALLRAIALGLAAGEHAVQLTSQTARTTKFETANAGWFWLWRDFAAGAAGSPAIEDMLGF